MELQLRLLVAATISRTIFLLQQKAGGTWGNLTAMATTTTMSEGHNTSPAANYNDLSVQHRQMT